MAGSPSFVSVFLNPAQFFDQVPDPEITLPDPLYRRKYVYFAIISASKLASELVLTSILKKQYLLVLATTQSVSSDLSPQWS